jgi:hypothetical protein
MRGTPTYYPIDGKWRWSIYLAALGCTVESAEHKPFDRKSKAKRHAENAAEELGIELAGLTGERER